MIRDIDEEIQAALEFWSGCTVCSEVRGIATMWTVSRVGCGKFMKVSAHVLSSGDVEFVWRSQGLNIPTPIHAIATTVDEMYRVLDSAWPIGVFATAD